jgi:NADP-dependent 3-hydroxy acid dehydrogenase YdfG
MTQKLAGKVAIITGASAGIGAATAIALAEEGAYVAIAARRADRLNEVAQKIEALGGKVLQVITDVTDEAQVQNLIAKTKETFGRIDILVNNAGIAIAGQIANANTDDWRKMIDVNIFGVLYATHAVLPILLEQKSGHIVNVSSVAGRTVRAGIGLYNLTKWGVNAFSEALRLEVTPQNIRVTVVEPGMVNTEIDQHISDPVAYENSQALRKSITSLESEDIANAIVYAVTQPERVDVNEIMIRPTTQFW